MDFGRGQAGEKERKAYPSDVSDDEWAFLAPYLTLMKDEAPQREHPLREVFNGLRWVVWTGALWRLLPHDLPPWYTVYQQTQRWLQWGYLRRWCTICGCCCANGEAVHHILGQR